MSFFTRIVLRPLTDAHVEKVDREQKSYLLADILESEKLSDKLTSFQIHRLEAFEVTIEFLKKNYMNEAVRFLDEKARQVQVKAEREVRRNALQSEFSQERSECCFSFPAVRGVQATKEYYIAQIPYKHLVKLFVFDHEDLPAELRAQRTLSEVRAKKIGEYIGDNRSSYILPALTATISHEMSFDPVSVQGASARLGIVYIPMESQLLINDGQHRRAGIERAMDNDPSLGEETIAITLFYDEGLEHSQQIFSDINSQQAKPSSSISTLYNKRSAFNKWVLEVLDLVPTLKSRIDFESSSIKSNSSYKLYTLVTFTKFMTRLTGVNASNFEQKLGESDLRDMITSSAVQFIKKLDACVPSWGPMINGSIPANEARAQFIIAHAVFFEALAVLGASIINHDTASFDVLGKLASLDVMRSSKIWENRSVVLGRITKTAQAVSATAVMLVDTCNLERSPELQRAEEKIQRLLEAS